MNKFEQYSDTSSDNDEIINKKIDVYSDTSSDTLSDTSSDTLSDTSSDTSSDTLSSNDACSDTSSDEEGAFDCIELNPMIKSFCDDFINEKKNIDILNKMINDKNIRDFFGLEKFFVGYYCQKKIIFTKKNISQEKEKEMKTITETKIETQSESKIDKNTVITI
jgi:hypothetical protein